MREPEYSPHQLIMPLHRQAFKPPGDASGIAPVVFEQSRERRYGSRNNIHCVFCKNIITASTEKIEISGSHHHSCTNPAGVLFHVGCFRSAIGCSNQGDFTTEFTWFPGFAWCFALCGRCSMHLGWHYQSNGQSFYGLILDHIYEEPEDAG